jgi:Fe2+ transport system protein FeoA
MIQELKMNFNLGAANPDLSLADLPEGHTATLSDLRLPPATSEHLMWLGFVPGAEVTAGQTAPGGDPRVYTVSGTAFALRRDVARHLLLEPADGDRL